MNENQPKVDTKEFEIPETIFSRDIESRVIQVIILQSLSKIDGVGLLGGTLIDTLFGRDVERVKGIHVEQDNRNHSVKVKVEVNVKYGLSIPEIAEQIQIKICEEITLLTGLHVSSVHVIIKGLFSQKETQEHDEGIYPASLIMESEEPEGIGQRV